MDISRVWEALQVFYEAQCQKAAGADAGKMAVSFKEYMEDAVKKEGEVFKEGEDVVMSHPPQYSARFPVNMKKPKEEMTLNEYKQYICNAVSGLPVSASRKMNSSGMLIFKEEAFVHMKEDPQYEKAVLDMLREKYSSEVPAYMPDVSLQVIGASEEECYSFAVPVKNYGMMMAGLQASGLGTAGLGSLGGAFLGTAGTGNPALSLLGLGASGYNMAGLGSGLELMGTGMSELLLAGADISGLGFAGDSSGSDWMGAGISGLGMAGFSGLAPGLPGIGTLGTGLAGSAGTMDGTSGAGRGRYASMVNAYKRTAANQSNGTGMREYKSRWRKKG